MSASVVNSKMVRGAGGNAEKTKSEKEGKCETKKSYEEEEETNEGLKINEKEEVCTLEVGEADDHFELSEGIRSN